MLTFRGLAETFGANYEIVGNSINTMVKKPLEELQGQLTNTLRRIQGEAARLNADLKDYNQAAEKGAVANLAKG
jgi:hypothetical protein